jgi:uncharacterized protein (AIM24 family)
MPFTAEMRSFGRFFGWHEDCSIKGNYIRGGFMALNDELKIYGLCLQRLNHQIGIAKGRVNSPALEGTGEVLLESYETGAVEEIIDILELYDVEAQTLEAVREKLDDLACTVSVLTGERLFFDYTGEGHLGLYLTLEDRAAAGAGTVSQKGRAAPVYSPGRIEGNRNR